MTGTTTDRVTLIHGDAKEVLRGIPPGSVDSVLTDPPYGNFQSVSPEGRKRYNGGMQNAEGWAEWDSTGITFDEEFWRRCLEVAKPGAYLLAFNTPRLIHRMTVAIEDAGWEVRDAIAWTYLTGKPTSSFSLKPSWEEIILCRKPLAKGMTAIANEEAYGVGRLFIQDEKALSEDGFWPKNVMPFAKPSPREKEGNDHPTVKPEALMRKLVRLTTPRGGVVLDPFVGSGTTAVAAVLEGRRCIGIDGVERYLEIAQDRLARL